MKREGFTLVELLAMLVVLGILMAVAIPNITGILRNNKLNVIKSDAIKMVDTAKIKMSNLKEDKLPNNGECVVFALNYLNDSEDINTGPNGGEYLKFESFVVVKKIPTSLKTSKYEYYVRLVENIKGGGFGINLANISLLSDENTEYITAVKNVSAAEELQGIQEEDLSKLSTRLRSDPCSCSKIVVYQPGVILK